MKLIGYFKLDLICFALGGAFSPKLRPRLICCKSVSTSTEQTEILEGAAMEISEAPPTPKGAIH